MEIDASLAHGSAKDAEPPPTAVWHADPTVSKPTSPTSSRPVRPPSALGAVRDFFVSLRLTVVLIVFSMVLIFAATLDQVNLGIWAVQEKYFRAFVVYLQVGPVTVPAFPGGYTIGGLLLANLVAAHLYRFTFAWRKAGVQLIHLGLILLLVGELLTGLWQEDFHMRLSEGETKNYAESFMDNELALSDVTDPKFDEVVAISEKLLATKAPLQHPKLPFRVVPQTYYPNSTLQNRAAGAPAPAAPGASAETTSGFGEHVAALPQPITHKPNEHNQPSAILELVGAEGPIGRWLVSTLLVAPQEFTHAGRTWRIALRPKRVYRPFTLTLLKFSHDRYAGTGIPKNFSSRLRLRTDDGRDDREVLIYMNNPLRFAGLTFYQSGFEKDDRTTILQVVRNPSWLFPYVACSLMTLGLTLQFGLHLVGFIRKRRTAPPPQKGFSDQPAGRKSTLPTIA